MDKGVWWAIVHEVAKNRATNIGEASNVGLVTGWENLMEKEMATHASILALEVPWTEEPGGVAKSQI